MPEQVVQISPGGFTTVFLVRGEGGAILVDAGNPGQAGKIVEALRAEGVGPDEVGLILITHGHTDHFGSAAALRERLDAPVAVHAADAQALRRGIQQPGSLNPTHWLWKLLSGAFSAASRDTPPVEPDVAFEEPWRLDDYGVAGEVIPTPGHTPGSVSVVLDSGEVIVGDMMGRDFLSLRRRAGKPFVAWDLDRNVESLREVLRRHPQTIYVTHGGAFAPEDAAHLI